MRRFLQRFKPLVLSLETGLSVILGIILGIFLGLPYYIGLFMALGWMIIPISLVQLFSGHDMITPSVGGGGFRLWRRKFQSRSDSVKKASE